MKLGLKYIILTITSALIMSHVPFAQADWNYITLSSYYAYPGQSISVHGRGYSPGEIVGLNLDGNTATATADNSGSFNSPALPIPLSAVNSKINVTASGNEGHNNQGKLIVAGYYPIVEPSSYYVAPGSQINFSGKNFEPGEPVLITDNGQPLATITTNAAGNFKSPAFNISSTIGDQTYLLVGQNSKTSYPVTVHVAVTNNYYHPAPTYLNINAPVTVKELILSPSIYYIYTHVLHALDPL